MISLGIGLQLASVENYGCFFCMLIYGQEIWKGQVCGIVLGLERRLLHREIVVKVCSDCVFLEGYDVHKVMTLHVMCVFVWLQSLPSMHQLIRHFKTICFSETISKLEPKGQNPLVLWVLSKSLKFDSNCRLWIIFRIGQVLRQSVGLELLEQVAPCLGNSNSSDLGKW